MKVIKLSEAEQWIEELLETYSYWHRDGIYSESEYREKCKTLESVINGLQIRAITAEKAEKEIA